MLDEWRDLMKPTETAPDGGLDEVATVVSNRLMTPWYRHRRVGVYVGRILVPVVLLVLWEGSVRAGWVDSLFVSQPSKVVPFVIDAVRDPATWQHLWVTIQETLLGFIIATVLGIGAGLIFSASPLLHDVFAPYIVGINSIPRIALAPLFVLWFGLGPASKVALVISLCFFIMLSATMGAIGNVDPDLTRLARSLGMSRRQIFVKVLLPWAVPGIFAGLELSLIYGFTGSVAGEMIAAEKGIGQQIAFYSGVFNTTGVLGTLLLLAVATTFFAMTMDLARRRLLRYRDG